MGSSSYRRNLCLLLSVGLLIVGIERSTSQAAKQKRRPPAPSRPAIPPPPPEPKSTLTGDKLKLTWDHFTRLAKRESSPSGGRDSAEIHSLAYTLASYHIGTSLAWTQATSRSPRIWRIAAVNLEIKMRTDRSWVRESLFVTEDDTLKEKVKKDALLARLLQHEQGHYDIVSIIARELYADLLALKEFNSEADLQRRVDELKSSADNQIEALNRKYDEQCGLIDRDRENQERWIRLLAQAKEGKSLQALASEAATSPRPSPPRPTD